MEGARPPAPPVYVRGPSAWLVRDGPTNCSTSACVGGDNASKRVPPACRRKTPSGTIEWKCSVACKAEPKN